jgi:autotransporter-associated beta strand protein
MSSTTWAGDIELLGDMTFDVEEGLTLILSGVIYGNYSFTKTGLGTLQLTNTNTYTGNTIISEGTLALVDGGSISNSSLVNLQGTSTFDISGINTEYTSILALTGTTSCTINLGSKTLYVTNGTTTRANYLGTVEPNDTNLIYAAACFRGTCLITMSNGSKKQIKDIQRGDMILNDKQTNTSKKVCRLLKGLSKNTGVRIPKGLIGNTEEIICSSNHPIWIGLYKNTGVPVHKRLIGNSRDIIYYPNHPIWIGNNRILAKDIRGVEMIKINEILYTIQYEEEGTYYVEDLKVDSISPNCMYFKLPKSLFFNKDKYNKTCFIKCEDDPRRNKPLMVKQYLL